MRCRSISIRAEGRPAEDLFGYQPELDLAGNDTIYGAIRYDDERRSLRKGIVRETYFHNLDLVPGNLELRGIRACHAAGARRPPSGRCDVAFFTRVQAALEEVAEDYDVVVIDCPRSSAISRCRRCAPRPL